MVFGLTATLAVAGALAYWLMGRITRPMAELERQAQALGAGQAAVPVVSSIGEVAQVSAALAAAAKSVEERDIALRATRDELRARAEQLEEVNANRATFLAQLSHELRGPLAPLMSGIAMLKAMGHASSSPRTLAVMERQLALLARLIDDLMDMGRIDRGGVDLRRELVEVGDVVADAIESCRPAIDARHQVLVTTLATRPLVVAGDSQRLRQVVCNLLNNASKYTPEGGRLQVSTYASDAFAVVSIRDDGVGFDPAQVHRMFEMFVRLVDDNPHGPSGLGIGLCVARALTQAHGGRIEAFSEGVGKGAVFSIHLPLAVQENTARPGEALEG